ncbi:MAG: carboxypeptidase M32 [Actinomycetota bacterium]|nr:carboxypeptidase M32 [Actinomycetota bacterium]
MSRHLDALKLRMAEQADLRHAATLADWDQQTQMPRGGGEARAESVATLERIAHELFIDDETGRALEGAAAEVEDGDPDGDDARLVWLVRRQYDKATRVPTELAADLARAASTGQEIWVAARENADFAAFAPALERNIELTHDYVECQLSSGEYECAYDVVLDDYEPEMKTSTVRSLFADLTGQLVPMLDRLRDAGTAPDDTILHGIAPVARQRELVAQTVALMGFDRESWRMDDAVHPFATRIGRGDVRVTTRWDEHYFPGGLYGAMHEVGHGLYEAGIPPRLSRNPLGTTVSLGVHESQSRLWENMVGRGRAFCTALAPLVSRHLGGDLGGLDPDALHRAVNRVTPSLIRVEADEVTYGLHIALRFELEQRLIDGTLPVRDLPEAWNTRFAELFGIEVPDDGQGVLQDVHWAGGLIGYFPTYSLGNLIAGQLWAQVQTDIPDLDDRLAAGELGPLREWLGEHVHRYGAKFTTTELLQRAGVGEMSVAPFVSYLKDKLGRVYQLESL